MPRPVSLTAANQVRPQPVAGPSSVKHSKTPKSLNAKPAPKHPKIRKEPGDANSNDVCGYSGHYLYLTQNQRTNGSNAKNAAAVYMSLVAKTGK